MKRTENCFDVVGDGFGECSWVSTVDEVFPFLGPFVVRKVGLDVGVGEGSSLRLAEIV